MKKRRRTKKLAGLTALATKLGLRKNKGLRDIPPEAMTTVENPNQDTEDALLAAALKAMPAMDPRELAKFDHGPKAVGDTVFIPFIGSDREEAGLDVKTTAYTVEQYKEMTEFQGKTCDRCFGWGFMTKRKCVKCKGIGRV